MSGTVPPIPSPLGTSTSNPSIPNRTDPIPIDITNNTTTTSVAQNPVNEDLPNFLTQKECATAKAILIDIVLAHEGPSKTNDTKIAALRIKFNPFKELKGEKVNGTFTRLKCLLDDIENNGVFIPQAKVNATFDSDSDVEEDTRNSSEFLADLNAEFHNKALLANNKRYYKRSRRVGSAKKPIDKTKETCFACGKLVSSEDEGVTKVKAFIAIAEEEPSVGKNDARLGQWVEITMKKVQRLLSMTDGDERRHVLDYTHSELDDLKNGKAQNCSLQNEISILNLENESQRDEISDLKKVIKKRGKKKDTVSSKEVLFSKASESLSKTVPKVTSDSDSEFRNLELLPPLPKLIKAEHIGTSADVLTLTELTLTPTVSEEIKKVKGLKEKIKISSDSSPSVSQSGSSKSTKGKQKTWFGPCKHCGFRNHLPKDYYMKPKCSTCGSTDHLTKQAVVRKTMAKLKA
ncbi:hypothetical protein Tco_0424510 [Tanacetum coccineum]